MYLSTQLPISELTLEEIFPKTLTYTECVYVDKDREVWVATEMCAQYLESHVDSIVIQGDGKPVGIVGGYDLLDHIRKNPTVDFQYQTKVEEVAFKDVPEVTKETKLSDLIEKWKNSVRAFAIIPNESGNYSVISARKMLEVGARCRTDISISTMPKKKIITFEEDYSLGKVLDLMFKNKTRKLVLENSDQYISDRLILDGISSMLKFQKDVESFLEVPIKQFKLERVREITDDLAFDTLCSIMDRMVHPYVVYKGTVVTPWDVSRILLSEELRGPLRNRYQKRCPHCGKEIDA